MADPTPNPDSEATRPDIATAASTGRPIPPEFADLALPGYQFLRLLGKGGMGMVFLARQERLNRLVAVKMLTGEMAQDPEYVQRLQREAVTLGNLSHPHIVGCHDIITHDARTFFVMEFVPGHTSVRDLIRRFQRLPERIALTITLQAARGLAHAHEKGVIHRDVKPENLQVYREEASPLANVEDLFARPGTRVMLLDFGLAKGGVGEDATRDIELTGRGYVVGSPSYMAPEQALGETVTFRADIYALGASLYHMLTGETPFIAGSATQSLNLKLRQDLPDPRQRGAQCCDETVALMHQMTAREPEDRPPDYATLITALDSLIQVLEGPSLASQVRRRRAQGRRFRLALGLSAAALAIGLLVWRLTLAPPPPLTAQREAWTVSGDSWSFAEPDDESVGEIALVGYGPNAIASLSTPIPPLTRIVLELRLPGDGAASIALGNQQRDVVRLDMVRADGTDRFIFHANGRPMELNRPAPREQWQWRQVEIAVYPEHIVLYIDAKLAANALIDNPMREYRLLAGVSESGLAQFHQLRLLPIEADDRQ